MFLDDYKPPTIKQSNKQFILHPNPTYDCLIVDKAMQDCKNFYVVDPSGRILLKYEKFVDQIEVNQLLPGMNYLGCQCNEVPKNVKFLKKN
ncbi:MAG TPA: hypothetical protein PKD85_21150 [Saprospiraceae bacterium]|nr:hypothetical protein [Saprospiraceae bacterium]